MCFGENGAISMMQIKKQSMGDFWGYPGLHP
jgi:hypothetical protein